jgi:hypothetical protein
MTTLEKFQELAKINFVQSPSDADIEIGELNTADGYELFYITQDVQNLQFDNEVYYYQPDFDAIMKEIDLAKRYDDQIMDVACFDIDEYFDEFMMLDYLASNMDEDEFEAFTNEKE